MSIVNVNFQSNLEESLQMRIDLLNRPRAMFAAIGKRVEVALRRHFATRNGEPNKAGWPKRGFWNDVRAATSLTSATDTEAVVTIASPALNLHINGGTVTPKRGKFLAIPATPEAYAAGSPREGRLNVQPQTIHMRGGRTALALVEAWSTAISYRKTVRGTRVRAGAESQGGRVHYWLVPSATIPKDERALPTDQHLQEEAADEARQFLARSTTRS